MSDLQKPSSTAPIEPSSNANHSQVLMDEENLNLQAPAFERLLPNYHQQQEEEKVCRICLETDSPETMIAPCLCKGGSKWVHRECLDEWRTHEKDRAFSKCTECLFEYHLQPISDDQGCVSNCCKPQTKRSLLFYWMVSRDACMGIVVQQLLICLLAALILACDPNHELQGLLLQAIKGSLPNQQQSTTMVWIYYALGWFAFFIGLGLYGSIVVCINGCDVQRSIPRVGPPSEAGQEPQARQGGFTARTTTTNSRAPLSNSPPSSPNRYYNYSSMDRNSDGSYHSHSCSSSSTTFYRRRRHYHRRRHYSNDNCCGPTYYPMYVYGGDDDCCCCCCYCCDSGTSGCGGCLRVCSDLGGSSSSSGGGSSSGGSGSGDGQHILLMVLLVVAIVLAIIGFFVGVVVVVVASQRIISRHIYLLQKRQLVQEFQVMDLQDYDLDKPIDDDDNFDSAAAAGENNDPNGIEMLQAPTMPTEDVQYLQKLGLMDHCR